MFLMSPMLSLFSVLLSKIQQNKEDKNGKNMETLNINK
jgi:hypothetical protein